MAAGGIYIAGGKSGHHRTGCWLTARLGNGLESATEIIPPKSTGLVRKVWVRVKWGGKSSPRCWRQERQGKPHPVQNQIG